MDNKRVNVKTRTVGNLRVKQAENRALSRSNARSNAFARGRNMVNLNEADILEDEAPQEINDVCTSNAEKTINVTDARRIRLDKWKQDKQQKEANFKSKQKPIFKTGVVHHSVGSPNVFGVPTNYASNKTLDTKKRDGATTRAMRNMLTQPSKRLLVQPILQNTKFKAPTGVKAMSMLTIPTTPKGMSGRKRLQAKPHVCCQVSTIASSLAFPNASGQQKKGPVFIPKTVTPNVHLPKTIQKAKTPNNAKPKQLNAVFKLKTPNAGIVKQLSSVLNAKATPSGSQRINILTPGLAPILDASPEVNNAAVDPRATTTERKSPAFAFPHSPHVTVERGKYSDRRKTVKSKLPDAGTPLAIPMASLSDDAVKVDSLHPAVQHRNKLNAEINRLNTICREWMTLRTKHMTKLSDNVNSLIDLAIGQTQLLIRSKFEQFRGLTFDCEKGECKPPVTAEDVQGFWEMVYIQVENIDKQFARLTELKLNGFKEESPTKGVTKKRNPKKTSKPVVSKVMPKSSGIRALIAAQRQKLLQDPDKVATPKAAPRNARLSVTPKATPHTARQSSSRTSLLKDVLKSSALRRSQHLSPIMMRVSQLAKKVGSPTTDRPATDSKPQTPYKSILKDISMIDSTVREGRKTVNFGQSTIKTLTPEFDGTAFESSPEAQAAPPTRHVVVESNVEDITDHELCVTPTEHSGTSEVRSTSLKRRTSRLSHLSAYQAVTVAVQVNSRAGNQSKVNKENLAVNSPVPNKVRTRQRALSFVDATPEKCSMAQDSEKSRRSYRKTPYKKTNHQANKPTQVLAECLSTENLLDTPTSNKSRRSFKKMPYDDAINNQSNDDQRVSLLPGMEERPSPGKATRFSTGDLISFNTPLRRSTRMARNK